MLKRILACLLAALLLAGAASAAFTDASAITAKYTDAVEAMNEKGIITGFPDGSFKPSETLTRAQAAKIICTMLGGAESMDAVTASKYFTDVPQSHWAVTFIGYCASKGIVGGVGGGRFDPDGKLTGYAFGKMLLVAHGHNAEDEGMTGSGWDTHTDELLKKEGRDYLVAASNSPISRQEACQLAYNFTFPAADTTAYVKSTGFALTDTALYKTYGRSYLDENGVVMLWAGNAIEFTAELSGDVFMTYTADEGVYLRTYVDGAENSRPRLTATKTAKNVKVASNVRPGAHTIRIVRDSDISKTNDLVTWRSVTFTGVKDSVKATAEKKLLIEFVGDSITVGKGVFSNGGTYTSDDPAHAATYAYSYLTAQAMDADWMLTARGGIALIRTTENGGGSCPKTMAQCYDYVNPFAPDAELKPYDFSRKANIVVLALGTNDNVTGAEFKNAVKSMIGQIKAKNGASVKIVILYGMMTTVHADELSEVAKEAGVYSLKVTRNNGGGSSTASGMKHPSDAGQAKIAEELTAFLKTIV